MRQVANDPARQSSLPDWSLVRRVLLIRLRSIGDTVLMTPSLAALKAWRPDIEIAVLMEPLAAPILEDHPLVDRVIVVEKTFASRALLIARLRRERFDIAFNMHGGTTATTLARLAGAQCTAGYLGYRHSRMLTARAPSPDVILGRAKVHSVEQQLALLHWTGVPWPQSRPQLSLAVSSEAESSVREKLAAIEAPHTGFAAIAPAAAFESKMWQSDGFAAVADHLCKHWNLPSVLIAGPGQEHIARATAASARTNPAVIAGLSLKELVALFSLANVFVGNDSGPMHIAAAFGKPVIAVFGSSNPTVWHPWTDSPYRVVRGRGSEVRGQGSGVGDQGETNAESVYTHSSDGIRQIPAAEVIAAVDEVLKMALEANHAADAGCKS